MTARSLVISGVSVLFLVSGCATSSTLRTTDKPENSQRSLTEILQPPVKTPVPKVSGVDYGELVIQGIRLKNTRFDYPVTLNSRVEYWVDYFRGRGRPHFEKYLERSEFFIPYIQPILKQSGMPEDLVYLAMIESGFNNFARSHAKAVGPWQFISATGKRYGLMVNWWVDERRDIRKSTLAAIEYLRDLYGMFGSWELAAAAYNAGEMKIARAIQRFGTKDFWTISKHRFLRPETRDYVPKIIAAALIAKNRVQFGFPESRHALPGADEAVVDGEIVKLIKTDKPEEDKSAVDGDRPENIGDLLQELGDEPADGPVDKMPAAPGLHPAGLLVNNDAGTDMPLAKPAPIPHLSRDGKSVGGAELVEFDVRSPADLLKIARAASLSYQTVKSLNPELLRWCTPPNVPAYRIRLPAEVKDKFLVTYNHEAYPRDVKFMTYKVRRGETLFHVARHFGIKVDPIADLNGVSPKMPLRNGTNVMLPMPNDRSRSLASLEVRDPPEKRKRKPRRYRVSSKGRVSADLYFKAGNSDPS